MTITQKLDHLRVEENRIERDMAGISPKTEMYRKLTAQRAAIREQIDGLLAQRIAERVVQ